MDFQTYPFRRRWPLSPPLWCDKDTHFSDNENHGFPNYWNGAYYGKKMVPGKCLVMMCKEKDNFFFCEEKTRYGIFFI